MTTYDANTFANVVDGRKVRSFLPQFEFGYGGSYATFTYSDLKLSSSGITSNGSVEVAVNITNTGPLTGKETAILFVRDETASLTPAAKRVRRFAKIALRPGETKTVKFTFTVTDLGFFGPDNKYTVEPGDFTVTVGSLSAKLTIK